jgi:hypothetical protein
LLGGATDSSARYKEVSSGERFDLDSVAKIGQAFDQTVLLLAGGTVIEVIGS